MELETARGVHILAARSRRNPRSVMETLTPAVCLNYILIIKKIDKHYKQV